MSEHIFTAGFLACGLGAGARGFLQAMAKLGPAEARFRCVGAVDIDPLACADFDKLVPGAHATVADLHEMQCEDLRAAWGDECPECVFGSFPCKGASGLLSEELAKTEKYQRLNSLVLKGMMLAIESWAPDRPAMLVMENVPRIVQRMPLLLAQVRSLLTGYGYSINEDFHECGEIGGLAQKRRRYLLVARLPSKCPAYVYRPPKRPIRGCGEELGKLPIPLPGSTEAGPLHVLPKLSDVNKLRLAIIRAGKDWRDLPTTGPSDPDARKRWEQKGEKTPGEKHLFKGKHGVMKWERPSRAVIGGPSNGAANVADPRLGQLALEHKPRRGTFGVTEWEEAAPTVRGESSVRQAESAVADPRIPLKRKSPAFNDTLKVEDWKQPSHAVTGGAAMGIGASVADPRIALDLSSNAHQNLYRVHGFDQPTGTITAATRPGGGAPSVADPRVALTHKPRDGSLGIVAWTEPSPSVTGAQRVSGSNTPAAVADPRLAIERDRFGNANRVLDWEEPAATVTAGAHPSNGGGAVADPRLPMSAENPHRHEGKYRVEDWAKPAHSVIGATRPGSGAPAVNDPRVIEALAVGKTGENAADHKGRPGHISVEDWNRPSRTVTAKTTVSGSCGPGAVADPRVGDRRNGALGVVAWEEPVGTVCGESYPTNGTNAVQDPRVPLGCAPRNGVYGMLRWTDASTTVTGAKYDSGTAAVADPRAVIAERSCTVGLLADALLAFGRNEPLPDVIVSPDDCWHRPLTTLDLAVLQGLPATIDGKPLVLAGKSIAGWRERIGNAVPVGAGAAIAESLLTALLAAKLGTWTLGSTGFWVRDDGATEDEAAVEATIAA